MDRISERPLHSAAIAMTVFVFVFVIALSASSAMAAPDQATKDRCTQYAQRAVAQYQLMASNPQCKVRDDLRWQNNLDNHYNGCLMAPEFIRKGEESARDNHLQACGGLSPAAPAATPDAATPVAADPSSPTAMAIPSSAPPASAPVNGFFAGPTGVGAPGKIFIHRASYGANIDPVRATYKAAYADIAGQCDSKADCIYVIDFHRIGDPFPGSVKDYQVSYTCGAEEKRAYAPPEAGFGSRIELSCRHPAAVVTAKPKINTTAQPTPAGK